MRHVRTVLLTLALAACAPSPPELRPAAGESIEYLQTFRVTERTSGGEELPDVTVVRDVTLTCTGADDAAATFEIVHGDVAVWIDGDTGEADFVATDAGAAERVFDADESELSTVFAALWATGAHLGGTATVERGGAVTHWSGALEEARVAREDDASTDLGGAFLESLVDDPRLLFAARDDEGRRVLRFRLAHWKATFRVAADVEPGEAGLHDLAYESRSGEQRDGPFTDFTLLVSGTTAQDPATGLVRDATLALDVSADVPAGPPGATRRDAAKIAYTLQRTGE